LAATCHATWKSAKAKTPIGHGVQKCFFKKAASRRKSTPPRALGLDQIYPFITMHLILKQVTTLKSTSLAPFDIALEVFDFDGSFLSLSLDLPETAMHSLSNQNIF